MHRKEGFLPSIHGHSYCSSILVLIRLEQRLQVHHNITGCWVVKHERRRQLDTKMFFEVLNYCHRGRRRQSNRQKWRIAVELRRVNADHRRNFRLDKCIDALCEARATLSRKRSQFRARQCPTPVRGSDHPNVTVICSIIIISEVLVH